MWLELGLGSQANLFDNTFANTRTHIHIRIRIRTLNIHSQYKIPGLSAGGDGSTQRYHKTENRINWIRTASREFIQMVKGLSLHIVWWILCFCLVCYVICYVSSAAFVLDSLFISFYSLRVIKRACKGIIIIIISRVIITFSLVKPVFRIVLIFLFTLCTKLWKLVYFHFHFIFVQNLTYSYYYLWNTDELFFQLFTVLSTVGIELL